MRARARNGTLLLSLLLLALGIAAFPAEARKRGPAVPAEFLGQWSAEKGHCDIQSESRLLIEPDFVGFYAAGYSVRRIVRRRDGSLKIFGLRADEGEGGSTPDSVELKLISSGELLAQSQTYYRCR